MYILPVCSHDNYLLYNPTVAVLNKTTFTTLFKHSNIQHILMHLANPKMNQKFWENGGSSENIILNIPNLQIKTYRVTR